MYRRAPHHDLDFPVIVKNELSHEAMERSAESKLTHAGTGQNGEQVGTM